MKRARLWGGMAAAFLLWALNGCGGSTDDFAAVDDRVTTAEDRPVVIKVLDNDSLGNAGGITVKLISQPEHGSAEVVGEGDVVYTPESEYSGEDAFVYSISDRLGRSAMARVEVLVTAVADPPEIVSLAAVDEAGLEQSKGVAPFTVRLVWDVRDVDSDRLECSLDFGDGEEEVAVECPNGSIEHVFKRVGVYQPQLTVSDGTNTVRRRITIEATTEFNIELRFEYAFSDSQRQVLQEAARRWSEVVVGDVADLVDFSLAASTCANSEDVEFEKIDDLVIFASAKEMDGESGTLAMAGPCFTRAGGADDGLPFIGMIYLDVDDLQRLEAEGLLRPVVLHEMGHVLGFGVLWDDLLHWEEGVDSCSDANEIYFIGNEASQAWQDDLLQAGNPPVENTGSAGTKCGHWLEEKFDRELMTGWIDGPDEPLSSVTVGSLADLGYRVNYYAADPFALGAGAAATQGISGILLEERLVFPQAASDAR